MEITQAIAVIAVIIYLGTFALYNRQIITGHSKPNAATWILWAFLAILNAVTYQVMSGDWVKTIMAYGSCLTNVGTFLFALSQGRLSKLKRVDIFLLVMGLASIAVWQIKQDATHANLLLQVVLLISFLPTCIGVGKDPSCERSLPWFLFAGAYGLTISVVILRWQGQYQDLVFPINCLLMHLTVGLLALRSPRDRKPTSHLRR